MVSKASCRSAIPFHPCYKVMLLVSNPNETDPDVTPVDEIKASFKKALKEAKAGQRLSLEEMWEEIDAE